MIYQMYQAQADFMDPLRMLARTSSCPVAHGDAAPALRDRAAPYQRGLGGVRPFRHHPCAAGLCDQQGHGRQ